MASIYIRDVDPDVVYKLRRQALDKRMSFKDFCLGLLTGESNGNKDHDVRGAGSGKEDAPVGSGNHAGVSAVRQASRAAKRLHSVQPVRSELAGRGGPSEASVSQPCAIPGHHKFRQGAGWFCSDCGR